MKITLFAFALAPALAWASNFDAKSIGAIFGGKKDAMSVMSSLTSMMGESQRQLQVAQRRHKKVVKQVRKDAKSWLQDEAQVYGKYFSDYSTEMGKASAELRRVVDEAKVGIAKSEAASAKIDGWKDPFMQERAKLGSQVASAESTIKKGERRALRFVQESEEHSGQVLEDEAQKLGMSLGDMTSLVEDAKKTMETVAEKQVPLVKMAAKSDATNQTDLHVLQDKVVKASQRMKEATEDANKRMNGFLMKTDKVVTDRRMKLESQLEEAKKKEAVSPSSVPKQIHAAQKEHAAPASKPAAKVATK